MNPMLFSSFASFGSKASLRLRRRQIQAKVAEFTKDSGLLRLEIGSGPKSGLNGWSTLDIYKECDIIWDLSNGIPLHDSSVSMIYASHVLEHFCLPDLLGLLQECWRVLAIGGVISIAVPNARLYIEAYVQGLDFPPSELVWIPGMPRTNSSIDKLNYMAYMGGHHKFMFDEESLVNILRMQGFRECMLREFDSDLDVPERKFESIYACGRK